jgi:hypothetical protein
MMLRVVHRHLASRSAAALVALALSGAVQLATAPEAHAGAARACRCPSHGAKHACECGRGHGENTASAKALPACHRGGSRGALAANEQERTRRSPCVQGACGLPEAPRAVTPRVAESFLIPRPVALVAQEHQAVLEPLRGVEIAAPARPETPPPRIG